MLLKTILFMITFLSLNSFATSEEELLLKTIDSKKSEIDIILVGQAVACAETLDKLHCSTNPFKTFHDSTVFGHAISYLQRAFYSSHFSLNEKKRINDAQKRLIDHDKLKSDGYPNFWRHDNIMHESIYKNINSSILNNAVTLILNRPLEDKKYINRLSATIVCGETLHRDHCISKDVKLFGQGNMKTSDGSKYGVHLDILKQASHSPKLSDMSALKKRIDSAIDRLNIANNSSQENAYLDQLAY